MRFSAKNDINMAINKVINKKNEYKKDYQLFTKF